MPPANLIYICVFMYIYVYVYLCINRIPLFVLSAGTNGYTIISLQEWTSQYGILKIKSLRGFLNQFTARFQDDVFQKNKSIGHFYVFILDLFWFFWGWNITFSTLYHIDSCQCIEHWLICHSDNYSGVNQQKNTNQHYSLKNIVEIFTAIDK